MNLKRALLLFLLSAMPLATIAQTNATIPQPGRGNRLPIPRTRAGGAPTNTVAAPAVPAPAPAVPAGLPTLPTPDAAAPAQPAADAAVPPVPAPAPAAPAAPPEEPYIKYNWTMPIEEVLDEIYSPLVGRTPLRANVGPAAVSKDTQITLKTQLLTKSEAIMALETIMGMNGVTVVPMGDKFFKVVTDTAASSQGGLLVTNSASGLPEGGRFITEVRQLKYADPDQVTKLLGLFSRNPAGVIYVPSTGSLILRDYTENVKRMLELVDQLDVESSLTIKSEVIPIRYALAADISAALGQLGAQGGTSVGRSSSGADFKSPTTSGSTTGPGGAGAPYGASTQSGLSTGASGARSSFANNLRGVVNGAANGGGAGSFTLFGQTKIIADERTNSLLVFADDEDMKKIKKIIKQLDVPLKQVLIEAIILEVNLTDGKNFGVSYIQNQSTIGQFTGAGGNNVLSSAASGFLSGSTGGTNGGSPVSGVGSSVLPSLPGGFSYFAKYGDFNAVLEAVANDSRISVLSRPSIQTSHAVEAELFIGNTVPYVTGTQNYGYSSGPSSTYTEKEVGIRLRVLPLINNDGLVVMDIDQEIEQLGPSVAIPGAGNVPTTTKRDAGAKVEVMSGKTIVLGGFISASRSLDHAGVPWLMSVPLLGNLFKSSSAQNTRTELVVLMRPTVLNDPEEAALVAQQTRDRMAGIKQAELDIERDEDSRNAQASKEIKKQEEKDAAQRAKDIKSGKITEDPFGNPKIEFRVSPTNRPPDIDIEDDTNAVEMPIHRPEKQ
jgi:general secretion pathway protein D